MRHAKRICVLHFGTQNYLNLGCVLKSDTMKANINGLQNPCVTHFDTHLLLTIHRGFSMENYKGIFRMGVNYPLSIYCKMKVKNNVI
jgi:hypothetical protein